MQPWGCILPTMIKSYMEMARAFCKKHRNVCLCSMEVGIPSFLGCFVFSLYTTPHVETC